MAGGMTHQEDGGALSFLATDTGIVVACNKGHYWQVDAQRQHVPPPTHVIDGGRPAGVDGGGRSSDPAVGRAGQLSKRLNVELSSKDLQAFGIEPD